MTWTTRQRFDIGGHPAIILGKGPDILLLHGVGLRAEAWGAQLAALSPHARITAPDMPGHGASVAPSAPLLFADYMAAAASVLAALNGPVFVVGHSMGAMLALDLTARLPDRICGVAALNAVFERSPSAATAVEARARSLDGKSPPDPGTTLNRWFGNAASPARQACHQWLSAVDPFAYQSAYCAFAQSTTPHRETLARLHCPALFMTGSEEPNSTPAMSRAMAKIAPSGHATIVEGAAHMMPMTHADEVNTALRAFFNRLRA